MPEIKNDGPSVKIDLNNLDSNNSKLNLSYKQKTAIEKFLKTKELKERRGIIELSQEGLVKLKEKLDSKNVDDEFLFLEKQLSEITTSSELLSGTRIEKLVNNVNLDSLSYDLLFGEDGKLKNLEGISEVTKRNLGTGFSLFVLEKLNKILETDNGVIKNLKDIVKKENLVKLLKGEGGEYFDNILKNNIWTGVKNMFDNIENFDFGSLDLKNTEIKNPIIGKKIFEQGGTDGIDINGDNITSEEKNKINELGKKLGKSIPGLSLFEGLSEQISTIGKGLEKGLGKTSPSVLGYIKDMSEGTGMFAKFLKFIIKSFNINLDNALTNSYANSIKNTLIDKITDDEYKELVFKKEDLNEEFFANINKNKGSIINNLKDIAKFQGNKQKGYEKDFILKLLNKNGPLKDKDLYTNSVIDYDKLSQAIENYKISLEPKKDETGKKFK